MNGKSNLQIVDGVGARFARNAVSEDYVVHQFENDYDESEPRTAYPVRRHRREGTKLLEARPVVRCA